MNRQQIKALWDSFIEYPGESEKKFVTTTSALLFAEYIADIASGSEREACAKVCDEHLCMATNTAAANWSGSCAEAIRARGQA